ncbi:tRNA epoxyqueuosine(34) reductase QueG [Euryhalocaulis sp.]|uniref:tRNA epoxyqueuosine(34) reductase QueG n=1 Tax=Euryhalocaulis sp. TaxID=2744307 RepID=UPI00257E75CC|nr:tRNA epoxyqueuosine(34) reductase QueG [Euryhalocaulis sp.]
MTNAPPDNAVTPDDLRRMAGEAGFDAVRFCRADEDWAAEARLNEFITLQRHGEMGWMETTAARRARPTAMWPDARSAIVLGMNYGPDSDPMESLKQRRRATISVYARNEDYHDLVKKRLKQVARQFADKSGEEVKVFVDTAPLMEKPLAAKSGLGWQGKHTNLVSRDYGSWLFLGVILTTADLPADEAGEDICGSCRRCLDVCPTDAFPAPYQLDARRCISYLTIEHAGPIPREFREAMGNRIYGCDDCLAVCPWNKYARTARQSAFHSRPELTGPLLSELAALDDAAFREVFSKSPIKRIGRDRFVRNVMIAAGNSGDPDLIESARALLDDEAPVVRGAAVWALSRLLPANRFADLAAARLPREGDAQVRDEWRGGDAA